MCRRMPEADDLSRRSATPIQSLGRASTEQVLLHLLDESRYTKCRNDCDVTIGCFRLEWGRK